MSRRSYNQYCGLAHALDLLGERWCLLIIRELLTGPKRYKDLQTHLPGVGTNLLSQRLKMLEEEAIIERRLLPPPASTEAYDLTERGRTLEPALVALARWGLSSIGKPDPDDAYSGHWSILAMKAVFRPERAADVRATYEFRVAPDVFHARVENGTLITGQGAAISPDVVMEADLDTYLAVVSGETTSEDAIQEGHLTIEGDMNLWERCGDFLDLSPLHQSVKREAKVLDFTGRTGPRGRKL
jgi:DNA-binding HxlR family transcriptional regulator